MGNARTKKQIAEFGDFQTPQDLAEKACAVLARAGLRPASIIEPTCGLGNFLFAALDKFPTAKTALGVEIHPEYVKTASAAAQVRKDAKKIEVIPGDFFATDWESLLKNLPAPVLVIGNPPWVTNAQLSALGSTNLPEKTNFQGLNGHDARTGKSNFDISEWMMIQMLQWLNGQKAMLAMLCKTSVARKILSYASKSSITIKDSAIYRIDAAQAFGAAVDACLLVCEFAPFAHHADTRVYETLDDKTPSHTIGVRGRRLIASVELYEKWGHLEGASPLKWRSGIKHDCSKVMELVKQDRGYKNGSGEVVTLEDKTVFPMLKSSELANGSPIRPKRFMLVTQRNVRDETTELQKSAPKTWAYLQAHADLLNRRGSIIYKNRSEFAIFGVGEYSFSEWKVAISGFYKKLAFKVIGTFEGKPIVLDDTSYFLPCRSEEEAEFIASLLNSRPAQEFFQAFIFWDAKRPITVDLLSHLDLEKLAEAVGKQSEFNQLFDDESKPDYALPIAQVAQASLF